MLFYGAFLIYDTVDIVNVVSFTALIIIIGILALAIPFFGVVYLLYRVGFALPDMVWHIDRPRAWSHIEASLTMTRGRFWELLFVSAPYALLLEIVYRIVGSIGTTLSIPAWDTILGFLDFFVLQGVSLMIFASLYARLSYIGHESESIPTHNNEA